MPPDTPARVRVTSPRMGAVRRAPVRTAVREIDEQTAVGEVYVRSLVRQQLRLGLLVVGVVVLGLGSLPLVFAAVPASRSVVVLGLPLPWLLLGVLVYPALLLAAWVHVRLAERTERDFTELTGSRTEARAAEPPPRD